MSVADFTAQAIVNCILAKEFPLDKNVGEEDSEGLAAENEGKTLEAIVHHSNSILNEQGNYEGGPVGRHWVLDPIDGTKGFLRGDQFAVCLALINNGSVQVGVMGCPNLVNHDTNVKGQIFYAVKGQGSFQDHASGSLIVSEAGGKVTDIHGNDLDFSVGRLLSKNKGILATNGHLHDKVLSAIAESSKSAL
ncbi:3'(2'),5'-bisphosphate nucleotidase 1 [Smittium culicis]|uniref:3'(2'),5'-bisphosphate nucleotidase 1 n=1 Tax=Smittium culicis TaxID=133412 RepID=A0A1R1X3J7_9FUNG|nr:3'(2'),5'-bisphosphate nucleotidase 1 [Smittium culicis]